MHSWTFIAIRWTFTEKIKKLMWAQWGGGRCVSAVVTAVWKMSHVLDGHVQLSHHDMKFVLISSSVQTDRLVVVSMLKNSVLLLRLYYIKLCYCAFASVVVSIELNRRHYFQSNTLTIFFCISNLAKWALFLVAPSNNAIQISSLPFPCATSRQGTESPQAGIQIYIFK